MTNTAKPHGFVTKSIHWLSAGLIGYGYLKGLDSINQLADPALRRFEVAFALLLGGLFLARLLWTHGVAGSSRLPEEAPKWEHRLSKAVHWGLYASVFGIVLSGLGIALGYSVPALGGVFLSAIIGIHEFALLALPLLLAAHVAGALWHRFVRRDAVFESMVGRWSA